MKAVVLPSLALVVLLMSFKFATTKIQRPASEHPTLAIGEKAPDFKLLGTDGKSYSLASFAKSKLLLIVFTCNHCPTAQAYEDRVKQLATDYASKGVAVVAISPNDPKAVRLD